MVIAKTASRNVALKVARMNESIMVCQASGRVYNAEVGL